MSIPQQKFREIVFVLLYSQDRWNCEISQIAPLVMQELSVTKKNIYLAQEKVQKILDKQDEIDALIAKTSQEYHFDRIQTVEKNVLRLGVYELLFDDQVPPKVAIAEAIRLSRKFSTPQSATFVNALLDHIFQEFEGKETNRSSIESSAAKIEEHEAQISEILQAQQEGNLQFYSDAHNEEEEN